MYKGQKCLPEYLYDDLTDWYTQFFKKTKISFRYPDYKRAFDKGHGFNDGSFTYYTVSGPANGGEMHTHFFYNASVIAGTNTAYRRGIIGGEVRPENSNVFSDNYPSGTPFHQDFMLCSNITHVTYMEWGKGFTGNGVTGIELSNARAAHARMGYNFFLEQLSVKQVGKTAFVDIDATVKQIGRAPFYYKLYLEAFCSTTATLTATTSDSRNVTKVASTWIPNWELDDYGKRTTISLRNIPATSICLNSMDFRLGSEYIYNDRPILWAQGFGYITMKIPLPASVPEKNRIPFTYRPPPPPRVIPFTSTGIKTKDTIGRCFVICAQKYCSTGTSSSNSSSPVKMGESIRGVSNGDRWKIKTTGNLYSIRCEINDKTVTNVVFSWPAWDHKESAAPWIMGGHFGRTVFPVDYFKQPGHYTFTVTANNRSKLVGQKTIDFDVDP
jgi:hypothetical protein